MYKGVGGEGGKQAPQFPVGSGGRCRFGLVGFITLQAACGSLYVSLDNEEPQKCLLCFTTVLDTSLGKHVFPAYVVATAVKYVSGSSHVFFFILGIETGTKGSYGYGGGWGCQAAVPPLIQE